MAISVDDSRVENRVSPIHGDGCFARDDVAEGDLIGVFRGRWLTVDQVARLEHDGQDMHVMWVDDDRPLDVENDLRHVNHAADPNAEIVVNDDGDPELYALKPITAGDEITMHYGHDWESEAATDQQAADLLQRLTVTSSTDARLAQTLFEAFGCLLIKDIIPRELIAELRAGVEGHLDDDGLEVGDRRRMITVPIAGPFADPRVFANDAILSVLRDALDETLHMVSQVAVVSQPGAEAQHVHVDHPWLFDEITATYAVTVIIPLLDVELEHGATRLWPGTHRLVRHTDDTHEFVDQLPFVEPYPQMGDAVLMDYHLLHSGRPNVSDTPRPILYNVYGRAWWHDCVNYEDQERLVVPDQEAIPEEHRGLFRQ